MQHTENGSAEEATVDVKFTDLPNALIACKVPEGLFGEGGLKVRTHCPVFVLITPLLWRHRADLRLVL